MTTYTPAELQRAFERSTLARHAGMTLEGALRDPAFRHAIELGAAIHRQHLRELARRAERHRAGRWLDRSVLDAYELTDRDAHLGEVAA